MDWKTLLACITGSVEEQLLLRNEYVVEENRILRNQIAGRVQLTDAERQTLAAIGKKLGKQALEEVATIVKPDTILAWHRQLVAQKFDGSAQRKSVGRPRVDKEIEDLVMQMAKENRGWGYDRIAGALAALGYDISDQSVGNILKRRGLSTAPDRKKTTTWKEFIRTHMEVLWATDFFSSNSRSYPCNMFLVMSMGQFEHPLWLDVSQMGSKTGNMAVSKQAHLMRWADLTREDWGSSS